MNLGSRKNLTSAEAMEFSKALAAVDFQHDKEARFSAAETIVKELREQIERDNIMSLLGAEVVTFNPGQACEFITRKGMKAFVHEPGSYAPRSSITNRSQTLSTELVSVHPEIEIGHLKSGRYGTIQDLKSMALDELLGRKYGIVWSTLVGSIASTASNYWSVSSSATAAAKRAALDSGFDYVADRQGSTITAIVGRRTALSFLSDYTAYTTYGPSEMKKQDIEDTNYIGKYRGVPVILLNQYTDGWGVNVIANNEIMLLGKDTVKIGVTRPLDFMEEVEVNTLKWHIHMFEEYGTAVFFPERNARIKLT